MINKDIAYGNRTVKSDEELFAPDDLDVELVGGKSQKDPFGYLTVQVEGINENLLTVGAVDEVVDDENLVGDFEDEYSEEEEKLGAVTSVLFEQEGSFTGDGTYLANVTATLNDVKGADDYDVEFIKIS
jgi:ribulose 1,5-bisphosphate carboxylase large subunit-like protein